MSLQNESISPFDQSQVLQRQRFEDFANNVELVSQARTWYENALRNLQEQKITAQDYDRATLVFSDVRENLTEEQLYIYFLVHEAVQLIEMIAPEVGAVV